MCIFSMTERKFEPAEVARIQKKPPALLFDSDQLVRLVSGLTTWHGVENLQRLASDEQIIQG